MGEPGYDAQRIKDNTPPELRGWSPQLGETFNVVVLKTCDAKIEEDIRGKLLDRKRTRPGQHKQPQSWLSGVGAESLPEAEAAQAKKAKVGTTATDDDSEDEDERQKRKDKRREQQLKDAEKEVQRQEKEAEKEQRKAEKISAQEKSKSAKAVHVQCNKIVSRLSPMLLSLERDLSDGGLSEVPSVIKKRAEASLKAATSIDKEAKAKLSKEEPAPFAPHVIDGFPANAKGWQDACTLLATQLSAIKRAARQS